ncbi:MAG: hypothetical protein K9J83_07785 [Desulfarculaceae bacterium]|nr:hypothetical protein [Desulfarculaceae bacterium]
MKKYAWWTFQLTFTIISIFFAIFGVDLLIGSYSLDNPFSFIMTFFAASFMILISLALMTSFIIRMVRMYRYLAVSPGDGKDR